MLAQNLLMFSHFRFFVAVVCLLLGSIGQPFAQRALPPKPNSREAEVLRRLPASKKKNRHIPRTHKPDSKIKLHASLDKLEKEAKARIEERVIRYEKAKINFRQKQQRDPVYFGHKRKPKRRKRSKRRLCKECGIVH